MDAKLPGMIGNITNWFKKRNKNYDCAGMFATGCEE